MRDERGTPLHFVTHIEDISLAALCAAEAPRAAVHAQAFNIGRSDANYQVRDIAQAVLAGFPGSRLEITGETGGDPRSYRVDFTGPPEKLKGRAVIDGADYEWTGQMKDGRFKGKFGGNRYLGSFDLKKKGE